MPFDVDPLPSLCPGSTVQFTCIALGYPSIDWIRNGATIEQYTSTTMAGATDVVSQLSVTLNSIRVASAFSADFNTTLIAIVDQGLSPGDNITCGNQLVNITDLIVKYTTIRK